MHPKLTAAALITATAALAWPVGARGRTERSSALAHGPNGTPRTQPYATIAVVHGGRLEGRVSWAGAMPALTALPVPPAIAQANPSCGATTPSPALEVSATQGVRGAVVYLADIARGAPATAATTLIEQQHCVFGPHVIATTVGSALRFANRDVGVLHNVHGYYSLTGNDAMFNLASPAGIVISRTIDREGAHRIVCDAGHSWMLVYVHAFEHPYFAVTDADGRYSLANIPPGSYRVHVWHEGWTATGAELGGRPVWSAPVETERAITVPADNAVTANFGYDATPAARFIEAAAPTARPRH